MKLFLVVFSFFTLCMGLPLILLAQHLSQGPTVAYPPSYDPTPTPLQGPFYIKAHGPIDENNCISYNPGHQTCFPTWETACIVGGECRTVVHLYRHLALIKVCGGLDGTYHFCWDYKAGLHAGL